MRAGSVLGGGSREGRHGAALEPLAQHIDALGGVDAVAVLLDATELVAGEAASEGEEKRSAGPDNCAVCGLVART